MHPQAKLQHSESSPSFNCYSSETRTIAKVIREEHASTLHKNDVVQDEQDFEFSFTLSDKNDIVPPPSTSFPVFNRNLLTTENVIDQDNNELDASFSLTNQLRKLFVDDVDEELSSSTSSSTSSEVDELENVPAGTFCVWRPKRPEDELSTPIGRVKKSSSTGSGSRRWRIRHLLRRSNSEGKEPVVMLGSKKADGSNNKVKRNSDEANSRVHERFYVRRRAENEFGKRRSYLPYRKDLVGLFGNW